MKLLECNSWYIMLSSGSTSVYSLKVKHSPTSMKAFSVCLNLERLHHLTTSWRQVRCYDMSSLKMIIHGTCVTRSLLRQGSTSIEAYEKNSFEFVSELLLYVCLSVLAWH